MFQTEVVEHKNRLQQISCWVCQESTSTKQLLH